MVSTFLSTNTKMRGLEGRATLVIIDG